MKNSTAEKKISTIEITISKIADLGIKYIIKINTFHLYDTQKVCLRCFAHDMSYLCHFSVLFYILSSKIVSTLPVRNFSFRNLRNGR